MSGSVFAANEKIVIGSKMHGESYLLAEIMAQVLENSGYEIDRKFGFGGTLICYNALAEGEIDLYPEYTGTISEAIFTSDESVGENPNLKDYQAILDARNMKIFSPFGFNNSYAMAIKKTLADERGLKTISDLKDHSDLKVNFSHEFINRDDGWPSMKVAYNLEFAPTGIQHGLAYKAIDEGEIDLTDAFTTDGDIERYGLIILQDNLDFFPKYFGASLTRNDFPEDAMKILNQLEGRLDDDKMRLLNSEVVINQKTFSEVANAFLKSEGLIDTNTTVESQDGVLSKLIENTITHVKITIIALSIGCIVALVLAFLIFRSVKLSRSVIYFTGLLQTIPSIALLALMIPIFGIGEIPAITALFLYSLLPILRSAVTALTTIDPVLVNVSRAIGMTKFQQLRNVLFPLALPNILAGIKTAKIICIGTATLAAFIGAGGLGKPIATGLALNDTNLILQGAIPAACLAIIVEILFEILEKRIIPEHMRAN